MRKWAVATFRDSAFADSLSTKLSGRKMWLNVGWTVLFIHALAGSSGGYSLQLVAGLIGAALALAVIFVFINIIARKIPLRPLFLITLAVLVFAGLTAYDTQRLKSEYIYGAMDGLAMERSAITGALEG